MRRARRALLAVAAAVLASLLLKGSWLDAGAVEDALPEGAEELLEGVHISPTLDAGEALGNIAAAAVSALRGILREAAGEAVAALAAAMLCSVAANAEPGGRAAELLELAGVFAIGAASASGVHTLTGAASQTMTELSEFSKCLLPTLVSASAASGAVTSAAAKYAVAALFLDVLVTLGERVVLPAIYMHLAVSVAAAAFGGLQGVAALLAKAVKLSLTVLATAFTLFLTVTGLVASTADATAVRLAKTALSAMVPLVGGVASDATDAVMSGAAVLRSAVGAFGLLAVTAVCAVPFLRLAVHSALYKMAAALAETVSDKRLSGLMGAVSSSYSMALGLAGTCALMLFLSILSVARAVTGL